MHNIVKSTLKNKIGKLTVSVPQLAGMACVGFALLYIAYPTKTSKERETSYFETPTEVQYYPSGGNIPANNSVDIPNLSYNYAKDSPKKTANAADNLSNTIGSAMSVGSAYQMTDTDGLGKSRNAEFAPGSTSGAASNGTRAVVSRVGQATAKASAAKESKAEGKQLATASMARATGGNGGPSYVNNLAGRSDGKEGTSLATATPGMAPGATSSPTDFGLANRAAQEGSSLFENRAKLADANFNANVQGQTDLERFAKQAVKVAEDTNRHNTEGNVFLNNSQLSGGVGIEKTIDDVNANISDLDANHKKLGKLQAWANQQKQRSEEQQKWLNWLYGLLSLLVTMTMAAIPLIVSTKKAGDEAGLWGVPMQMWALALAIIMSALWTGLMAAAGYYMATFNLPKSAFGWTLMAVGTIGIFGCWTAYWAAKDSSEISDAGDAAKTGDVNLEGVQGNAAGNAPAGSSAGMDFLKETGGKIVNTSAQYTQQSDMEQGGK